MSKKTVFVTENKPKENKEEKAPKWKVMAIQILVTACIMLTFALVAVYANQAKADYSYQSFFSQYKEVRTDCIDNIVMKDIQVWTKDNTQEIRETDREIARLQEELSRLQVKKDALMLDHWKPIFETREIASQVCTERVIELPYCWDWVVNGSETCDWTINCSSICKCNDWFMLMTTNTCQAIPMSEEKEPELMKTGASIKKK